MTEHELHHELIPTHEGESHETVDIPEDAVGLNTNPVGGSHIIVSWLTPKEDNE